MSVRDILVVCMMVTSYCFANQNNPENFWLRYNQAASDFIAKVA